MPAYDYRCESCDTVFEIVRPASDRTDVACPVCDSTTKRIFSPVGVVFKGPGFHSTDYRRPDKEDSKVVTPESTPCSDAGSCDSCPVKDA